MKARKTAQLLLADGTHLVGTAIGHIGTTVGEMCFNTGMTGYQEIYTDPSYYGQIIIQTTPHIGNYGVHNQENEAAHTMFAGLVCDSYSDLASRLQGDGTLQDYLLAAGVVGIADVDTRALVRHIRSAGAMNGIISAEMETLEELQAALAQAPDMANLELSSQVSTKAYYKIGPDEPTKHVAVLDLGVKRSILSQLARRGVACHVYPARTTVAEMMVANPDGFFLSNGPGDPAAMPYAVQAAQEMLATKKPLFGICLGNQILGMAVGASTYKMRNGHRGLNHPVQNLQTGRSEITSQNHGFALTGDSVAANAELELTHTNLNDGSVEGIRHRSLPAFSVQYHPEASPGPQDSHYLFDQFVGML